MSYLRYRLDLAFKEPVPVQVRNRLNALENELKLLLKNAEIINEGLGNEENTKKAGKHICHHDTGESCEEEEFL